MEWFMNGFLFALGVGTGLLLTPNKFSNKAQKNHDDVMNILREKIHTLKEICLAIKEQSTLVSTELNQREVSE